MAVPVLVAEVEAERPARTLVCCETASHLSSGRARTAQLTNPLYLGIAVAALASGALGLAVWSWQGSDSASMLVAEHTPSSANGAQSLAVAIVSPAEKATPEELASPEEVSSQEHVGKTDLESSRSEPSTTPTTSVPLPLPLPSPPSPPPPPPRHPLSPPSQTPPEPQSPPSPSPSQSSSAARPTSEQSGKHGHPPPSPAIRSWASKERENTSSSLVRGSQNLSHTGQLNATLRQVQNRSSHASNKSDTALTGAAGFWTRLGVEAACLASKDSRTWSNSLTVTASSRSECHLQCSKKPSCRGVEFRPSYSLCKLWMHRIGSSVNASGTECWSFLPIETPAGRPSAAKVWLTTVDSDGLPKSLLERQPDLSFRPGGAALRRNDIPHSAAVGQGAPSPKSARSVAGTQLGGKLKCRTDKQGHPTQDCRVVIPEPLSGAPSFHLRSLDAIHVIVNSLDVLQEIDGFGAAMTHSSAQVLASLKLRNTSLYRSVMERLFGSGPGSARISIVRIPIGSSDFSSHAHTFDDAPATPGCQAGKLCAASCSMPGGPCARVVATGQWAGMADSCSEASGCGNHCESCHECQNCCCVPADWSLSRFGPMMDDLIDVLRDAKAMNAELNLIGSPWTPPAWLKAKGTLEGLSKENTLLDSEAAYAKYAEYLASVVYLFHQQGIPFSHLTLQNEPLAGTQNYPSMHLNATNAVKLGRQVQARITQLNINPIKILAYDHNWDNTAYPLEQLKEAPGLFAGVAWHCYAGSMKEAQEKLHEAHPEAEQHVTQCSGSFPESTCDIRKGMQDFGWNHNWDMTNVLLGATTYWARSVTKWIIVTNEDCGPTLPAVDFRCQRPLVSLPSNAASLDDVKFNQDFWSVSHMSRFIRPGARRVGSYVTGASETIVEVFRDDEAATLTMIAVNLDTQRDQPLVVSSGGATLDYNLPRWSTAVLVWDLPGRRPES